MANVVDNSKAMGYANAVQGLAPIPVQAKRDPLNTDRAAVGQLWVNTVTQTVFVCAGTVANVTTWNQVEAGGGAGNFATLHVTGASALDGAVTGGAAISATTTLTAGTDITATAGNIVATAGQVNAGTTMTAGTGITATTGNIVATAGQVNAGSTMTAGTGITATTGNIVATAGQVIAGGDTGGVAATNSLSNAIQAPGAIANTLVGTNGGQTNAGYIKMYVGVTAVYVPYFTAP